MRPGFLPAADGMRAFVGDYAPEHFLLNSKESMAVGPYATTHYYMEAKKQHAQAMVNAKQAVLDVAKEFEKVTGRSYGLFEAYRLEDADYAMVLIGSAAGTAKDAVDELRDKGVKAGLLKIRLFRPFPAQEIANALAHVKAMAIMDRAESLSSQGGPLGSEVMAALYRARSQALAVNYIYGLGGRDMRVEHAEGVFEQLRQIADAGEVTDAYRYLGLRE